MSPSLGNRTSLIYIYINTFSASDRVSVRRKLYTRPSSPRDFRRIYIEHIHRTLVSPNQFISEKTFTSSPSSFAATDSARIVSPFRRSHNIIVTGPSPSSTPPPENLRVSRQDVFTSSVRRNRKHVPGERAGDRVSPPVNFDNFRARARYVILSRRWKTTNLTNY